MENKYTYDYIITSVRRRSDEIENKFSSNTKYNVGDTIVLDGIDWIVDEVLGESASGQPFFGKVEPQLEIKTVVFSGYCENQFITRRFEQFTFPDGHKLCKSGRKWVDKNEGNQLFVELLQGTKRNTGRYVDNYEVTRDSVTMSIDDYIAKLDKGIDRYTEYIDDPRVYKSVCENNDRLSDEIKLFKELKLLHGK